MTTRDEWRVAGGEWQGRREEGIATKSHEESQEETRGERSYRLSVISREREEKRESLNRRGRHGNA